ncbi:MAG: tripartite tricarboxylate transporter TctB family protein [Burkholderiales bacterium]|nr:MAG: tripartite tricarboxylate transporter TctB family protein [Burkholderiales bacterium]
MPRADFAFSIVLVLLGSAVIVESWRMPRLTELGVNPMTAPGLTPGLIGVVLLVLGLALLWRSSRAGGWRLIEGARGATSEAQAPGAVDPNRGAALRIGSSLVLTIGYAGALVGRLPFWLATVLFVFAFVLLFERLQSRLTLRRVASAALLAAATAAAVTYVFQELFLVRLP